MTRRCKGEIPLPFLQCAVKSVSQSWPHTSRKIIYCSTIIRSFFARSRQKCQAHVNATNAQKSTPKTKIALSTRVFICSLQNLISLLMLICHCSMSVVFRRWLICQASASIAQSQGGGIDTYRHRLPLSALARTQYTHVHRFGGVFAVHASTEQSD